ncbi:asparagine synthase-related protein [Paenibacillus chartarius]|uniref:asparagine synthase (glutamine-hydrolyzing) n=1 Tax=Paenibacillus chartarius TaxID=747481 RepID=A0ABV6DKR2_9BACL
MSTIVGMVYESEELLRIEEESRSIMNVIRQQPADDSQMWSLGRVFFGCHARWITPESVNERLPFYEERHQVAITADAIIDNRAELVQLLQIESSMRDRITDSELILGAYLKWGVRAPRFLVGDFAFMIWDQKRGMLFGARDLVGNRTLYYNRDRQRLAFCTTITPLFALPAVNKGLNDAWLAEFLAIPAMLDCTDTSSTVYRGIQQLPPGHSLTYRNGKLTVSSYGTLVPEEKLWLNSNEEYEEAFRDVFDIAVKSKLRTHREVGATLSGGLDSGAVVSFAAQALRNEGKQLHTFSFVPVPDFEDWTGKKEVADESPYIRSTVEHVGNIRDQYLSFAGKNPLTEVDDWLDILEMPYKFYENSYWIKGFHEQAAQQQIGVMLTGARGNYTISWGSAIDYYAFLLKRMHWVQFYQGITLFSRNMGVRRSRLLPRVLKHAFPVLRPTARSDSQADIVPLIHPDFAERTKVFDRLRDYDVGLTESSTSILDERERHFLGLSVISMQGTSSTKLSQRYSLWERDPTCDPRVVRFCLSIPIEQYVQNGIGRSLVRRATKGYLPDRVRLNSRVRGVQGVDWLHRMLPAWGEFVDELQRLCADSAVMGLLDIKAIREAMARIGGVPRPEHAFDPDIRLLMRSIIVYRFVKKHA